MSQGTIIGGLVGLAIGVATVYTFGAAGVIIMIGLGAGIGSMMDPIRQPSPGSPEKEELTFSTTQEGGVIPEVFGCQKLTGNILHYWGNWLDEGSEGQGGKGGGGQEAPAGDVYHLSWLMEFCMGPVDTLLGIYAGNECVWAGAAPRQPDGKHVTIIVGPEKGEYGFGGFTERSEGGGGGPTLQGKVRFYFGTEEQTAPDVPTKSLPQPKIHLRYKHQCYMHFDDCEIGGRNACPSVYVVISRAPAIVDTCSATMNLIEYNPVWAIYYMLTTLAYFPTIYVNIGSFRYAADMCAQENFSIGAIMNQSTYALVWIDSILRHINGVMYWGGDGQLHIRLLRADEDKEYMQVVDDSILLEPPDIERGAWMETLNQYKVLYPQRLDCPICTAKYKGPIVKGMPFDAGYLGPNCGVWMWGTNERGDTGQDHNRVPQNSPVSVKGVNQMSLQPHEFKVYSNGGYEFPLCSATSWALRIDCTIWAWGSGGYGQLGNGTWGDPDKSYQEWTPVMVNPYGDQELDADPEYPHLPQAEPLVHSVFWTEMANGTGAWHFCSLDQNNKAWCWGADGWGQLGDWEWAEVFQQLHWYNKNTPTSVHGDHAFVGLSVGAQHSLGLKDNGKLFSWGGNQWGELGQDHWDTLLASPVAVSTTVRFTQIWASHFFNVCLDEEGHAWAWGTDEFGQCGQDVLVVPNGDEYNTPMSVIGDHVFVSIVCGHTHSMGLKADGSAWCWGSNYFGECGQNINPWYPGVDEETKGDNDWHWFGTPISVMGLHSFRYIGAGNVISYGIKDDGTIWAWGNTFYIPVKFSDRQGTQMDHDAGWSDADATALFGSELEDLIRHDRMASPMETHWHRDPTIPPVINRVLTTDGIYHIQAASDDLHYPHGQYWIFTISENKYVTITLDSLGSDITMFAFWTHKFTPYYQESLSYGYDDVSGWDATTNVPASSEGSLINTNLEAGTYHILAHWNESGGGYQIKCVLTDPLSATTTTT